VEEKSEQYKANLEKPAIVFEEYPQKEGIRTEAYTLPNYQINHTDPSVAGLFSNYTLILGFKIKCEIYSWSSDPYNLFSIEINTFMCVGLQKVMKSKTILNHLRNLLREGMCMMMNQNLPQNQKSSHLLLILNTLLLRHILFLMINPKTLIKMGKVSRSIEQSFRYC
jgi:hypothetical protein